VVDVRPRDGLDEAGIERLGAFWSDAMQRARAMESMRGRAAGQLPEGIDRLINEVHAPSLDWRTALWRHVVRTPDDFTGFDRRHVWQGLYVEELEGEGLDVDVCIDTSGSVGDAELSEFLGELRGILSAYPSVRCRLYYADAACTGPFDVAGNEPLPVAKGGGGTDFRPFFEASTGSEALRFGHERLAVYLTDGHGVFPKRPPRRPVLWVVTPGGVVDAKFPFGEVVRMRTGGRP
jgi:predicted metal-dependent peptidase